MTGATLDAIPGKGQYTEASRQERLEWLRKRCDADLGALDAGRLDARALTGNIENFVAAVAVPVGLAGPLLFHGEHARGEIVAPLATTEGALVASASRGARAVTLSGGVTTRVLAQRMIRAPAFEFADVHTAARFVHWLEPRFEAMAARVRTVSRHAELVAVEPYQIGRYVHVRFVYGTADAAGQNMTTAATWRVCQWLGAELDAEPGLRPEVFVIEGNLSGDKKLSQLSLVGGRGTRVTAECVVDRAVVEAVLKTTPEAIERLHRCALLGGQQAGMVGHSVNAVNMIAGIFVATGQDVACVHESGTSLLSLEVAGGDLRGTLLLPSLVVGTVGGGTALPQQQDFLAALGCAGAGHAGRLAEIIAGFALALDLSTMAAVAGGQFADAHRRLGRSRRVNWLRPGDLTAALIEPLLAEALGDSQLAVTEIQPLPDLTGQGILSDLTARGERRKLLGLHPLRVTYRRNGSAATSVDLIAKVKPLDEELLIEIDKLASLSGPRLAQEWSRWGALLEFKDTHTRELAIYRSVEPRLRAILPRTYGVLEDPRREAYVILMERLGADAVLTDTPEQLARWTPQLVDAAVRGIAGVHAAWLGRVDALMAEGWLGQVCGPDQLVQTRDLWAALLEHNAAEHPRLLPPELHRVVERLVGDVAGWSRELAELPQTLLHNDFNPRNLALRGTGPRLVAYDWELASVGVPQRDLAELLTYVLDPAATPERVAHHLETHRRAVAAATGTPVAAETWRRGYQLALHWLLVTRLQLHLLAHTHREYPFLGHVLATARRLWEIEFGGVAAGAR